MPNRGILSSPYQRRVIATFSIICILVLIAALFVIYFFAPETRGWKLVSDILVALTTSAAFAFASAVFLYFFTDPFDLEASTQVLPKDIGPTLNTLASNAANYKLNVRTGRHFRADVLPLLSKKAREQRMPMRIEVILLDFRNQSMCRRYAEYRKYDTEYVQHEILATILMLIEASNANPFLEIELYLSSRLSTFRLDGSSDEVIITREDAVDYAARYSRSNPNYAAFMNEFSWVQKEAERMQDDPTTNRLPTTLNVLFPNDVLDRSLVDRAERAKSEASPYDR
jgi:hypothetical protein